MNQAKLWDAVAARWDGSQGMGGDSYRTELIYPWIDSLVLAANPARILDVGCGNGALVRHLCKPGREILGVDISTAMIHLAEARSSLVPGCSFLAGDIEADVLGGQAAFDMVICMFVLQDVFDLARAMRNISAMVNPNGRVVLVLDSHCNMTSGRSTRRREWAGPDCLDKLGFPGQKIYWYEEDYSISYVRPIEAYVQALSEAGFKEEVSLPIGGDERGLSGESQPPFFKFSGLSAIKQPG